MRDVGWGVGGGGGIGVEGCKPWTDSRVNGTADGLLVRFVGRKKKLWSSFES